MSLTIHEPITPEQEPVAAPVDPILARAVETLRLLGWTQRKLRNTRTGEVCAIGAIAATPISDRARGATVTPQYPSTSGSTRRMEAVKRLALSLGWKESKTSSDPDRFVATWNDAEGRTAAEVSDALERAAYGL